MARTPSTHRRTRGQRGQVLIEFAITSVVFLMTIFGATEFGMMVWQYNMVSNLAQEGVRWASVRGSSNSGSCADINSAQCQASATQVEAYVQSRASWLGGLTANTYSTSSNACTATTTNPSALAAGNGVCVTVQKSFTVLTRLIPGASFTLQSTAQMIMAR